MATQTDTGQAFAYLGIEGIVGFVIALLSVMLIAASCYWFFLQFADLGFLDTSSLKGQMISVFKMIGLPLLIGSVLIIPYRIFPIDRGFNQFFNLIPWLPWFLMFAGSRKAEARESRLEHPPLLPTFVVALIILLLFQFLLAPGIQFPK